MRRLLLLLGLATSLASPLAAQVTVSTGQSNDYIGPLGIDSQGGPLSAIAQTFMRPAGMNYLQAFTLYLTNSFAGDMLFLQASVYRFDTDHLSGPALFASALFAGSGNVIGNDAFTFGGGASSLNVLLAPNAVYAIVLSALPGAAQSPDGSTVLANLGATDYANGALYYSFAGSQADLSTGGAFAALDGTTDAAFSASFSVTATPEPATLMLVATGFAGMGGVVARRRRKASR